jgi:hypothetical protein
MLAANASELPGELKHLIMVLALYANNQTGRGLTGQARLARYLGCGPRNVRKLLARLEAAWGAGTSPVGLLREKRWLNSDAYQLVVREGAPLALEITPDERPSSSANDRNPRAAHCGTAVPNERNSSSNQAELQFQKRPVKRNPRAYKLRSPSTEGTPEKTTPENESSQGGAAPAGASRAAGVESAQADADASAGGAAARAARVAAALAERNRSRAP